VPLKYICPNKEDMIVVAKARGLKAHLLERYANKYKHLEVQVNFFYFVTFIYELVEKGSLER
jgi:hypothetical protein